MSEKQKNLGRELMDVLGVLWRYCTRLWIWLIAQLSKIRLARVWQIVGLAIIIATSFALIFDTLTAILLIGDPHQVSQIIHTAFGVELFAYIDLAPYLGLIAGGAIMDIAILTLILWLGIYLFCGRNYFIYPAKAWLYAMFIAVFGGAVFLTSLFYTLPELMALEKDTRYLQYENKVYPLRDRHHFPHERYYNMPYSNEDYSLIQRAREMEQMMDELFYGYGIGEVHYR
ncbi:MAG: hypothetical protein ACKKL4_01680 [Patescibacteria group bacterium]